MTDKPKQSEEQRQMAVRESEQLVTEGETMFASGQMVDAAQRFLKAVELDPRSVRGWNDLGVALHGVGEVREAMTAFRTALNIAPGNEDAERNMVALQEELKLAEEPSVSLATADAPWPLATDAPVRVLAWPDFTSTDELEGMLREYAPVIAARNDLCLCIRLDPVVDGSVVEASKALREAHERVAGDQGDLEILLVAEALTGADWARLVRSVQGIVMLPSSGLGRRAEILGSIDLPRVQSAADLEGLV